MIISQNDYSQFGASGTTLCFPFGTNVSLQGSYSSAYYSMVQIAINPCQNKSWDNSCASPEEINTLFTEYGNFVVTMMYINPVINPTQTEDITYYLELNDFVIFSKSISAQAWLQFSDYTINTDTSILPFTNMVEEKGAIALSKSRNYPMDPTNYNLASIIIVKSPNSLVYDRQVQKISAVFSYIGGLVGAVTAFLFMLKAYTDSSLEVTIGIDLFEQIKKQKQPPSFSLIGFLKLSLFRILRLLRWKGKWESAQKYSSYQDQALKQLDIGILLKRIYWLEFCMSCLIPQEFASKLKESQGQKMTIVNAKTMRTLHSKKQLKQQTIQVEQYKGQLQQLDLDQYERREYPIEDSSFNIQKREYKKQIPNKLGQVQRWSQMESEIVVKRANGLYFLRPNLDTLESNQGGIPINNSKPAQISKKISSNQPHRK